MSYQATSDAFNGLYDCFARTPLSFTHGKGAWLYDEKGTAYLDFMAGIAVNALGHAHPALTHALKEQAEKLWHTSNLFQSPLQAGVAATLCKHSFADKVFFCNSGAEALECAIKTARRYHYSRNRPEKIDIISFEGAFHGRTLATLAAGGQEKYLAGFGPKAAGFIQVPLNNEVALTKAISPTTAALLIEPIQGEGGVRVVSTEFLRTLRALCNQNQLLLIFDEVQSGSGRAGTLFAHETAGTTPDIMALAKGLGGGFPLGACLATHEAASGMGPGSHGTTFGGNALAMAVANKLLEIILAPHFLPTVQERAKQLQNGLYLLVDTYPQLLETVRGRGLFLGLKCKIPNTKLIKSLETQHMLVAGAGDNVVRLLPPLNINTDEINIALNKLDTALQTLQ